jgi:hypothetical protein
LNVPESADETGAEPCEAEMIKKRLFRAAFVYFCYLLCSFYDLFCSMVFYKLNYRLIVLPIP